MDTRVDIEGTGVINLCFVKKIEGVFLWFCVIIIQEEFLSSSRDKENIKLQGYVHLRLSAARIK